MAKKIFPFLLLGVILFSSCGVLFDKVEPAAQATETVEATVEAAADSGTTEESTAAATQEPLTNEDNPCIPFSVLGYSMTTPFPDLPPVTEDDYSVGPDDAALTFIVYSEPQCPYCAQLDPVLDEFQQLYPDDVRVVFRLRPFPVTFHNKSLLASQAMVAAGMQDKFDEFRKFIFERQYQDTNDPEQAALAESEFWSGLEPTDFDAWLKEQVPALGIDADQLLTDMYSDEVVAKVQAFSDEANNLGITGTPTLLINGYKWPESQRGTEIFSIYLRLIKNQANELDACAPTVIDAEKTYTATISTTQGDIKVELYPDKAPMAVNSFVYLAEQGWYDNLPIISSNDFILSGDPSDTGYGGAGYAYMDETNDLSFNEPGMLAVYSVWPGYGTNGSMFFINKTALTEQDGRTIFGKVTEGLDLLDKFEIRDDVFDSAIDKVLEITISEE
jgi:cyclophilin family peptidyl-prolyl cis-trans isomerase/protein-disulfide isomerase